MQCIICNICVFRDQKHTMGDPECIIQRKWNNALNSEMIITEAKDGIIKGLYNTKVGDSTKAENLTGYYKYVEETQSILLGFVVIWKNVRSDTLPSVTSWSGECFNNTITTTWILTRSKETDNKWENTLIGKDTFI